MVSSRSAVWLSHALDPATPLYGGAEAIAIRPGKSMANGDSCNTTLLALPAHAGSHVDAPCHFVPHGKAIDDYPAASWVFSSPGVMTIAAAPGQLIDVADLTFTDALPQQMDLLLIRTGFEAFRGEKIYWADGPGLAAGTAGALKGRFPSLQAIGFDFISISSLAHREEGRQAHRAYLGAGIRIFEDLSLAGLDTGAVIAQVVALPLRLAGGDGAPCTVIGFLAAE